MLTVGGCHSTTDLLAFTIELADQNTDIRKSVIAGFGHRKSERAGTRLVEIARGADNLKRTHEYGGYPVYWAGRIGNEESLNYLKSIIDSPSPETNRLAEHATFAVALHDDAQVETILTTLIRRPVAEPIRSRAIYWLGYTPESQAKNTLLAEIARNFNAEGVGQFEPRVAATLGIEVQQYYSEL